MLDAGMDLDQPFQETPWEEAASAMEEHVRLTSAQIEGQITTIVEWPQDASLAWLQNELMVRISEEQVAGIQDIVAPYNEEIRSLGAHWASLLDSHVFEKWKRGDFVKAPFSTFGVATETGFYVQALAGKGWSAVIVLKEEECPDMVDVMTQIDEVKDRRRLAAMRCIRPR